jgi:hypothetical protein
MSTSAKFPKTWSFCSSFQYRLYDKVLCRCKMRLFAALLLATGALAVQDELQFQHAKLSICAVGTVILQTCISLISVSINAWSKRLRSVVVR